MKRRRTPFFELNGHWYIDLLFNFDEPIAIDGTQVGQLLEAMSDRMVVARRMTKAEVAEFIATREDIDAESFAFIVPSDAKRWVMPNETRWRRRKR